MAKKDNKLFYETKNSKLLCDDFLTTGLGEKMKQNEAENKLLRIGQLAKQTGELVTTIRFWTNEGLLEVKEYSQGGYQLYEPSMIERVKEVRRLQNEKRLTIAEIKEEK